MVEETVSEQGARSGSGMGHGGFTQQELRDIFNLDPDRPQDHPAIAALQASATRLRDEPRTVAPQRTVQHVIRQMLRRHRRNAAGAAPRPLRVSPPARIVLTALRVAVGTPVAKSLARSHRGGARHHDRRVLLLGRRPNG
jgi:hypothetical protein